MSSQSSHIQSVTTLLLGGGFTLKRVAAKLPKESFVITTRSEENLKQFHNQGYHAETVDLLRLETLKDLREKYSNLSTIVDSVPPLVDQKDSGDKSEFVSGVNNVVDVFGTVSRILYLSTTGVYGEREGNWVDEETPPQPFHSRGLARLQCEEIYRERFCAKATALRISAIYGNGRGIESALRKGTYPYIENGTRWSNRIHVEDLSNIIVSCISTDSLPSVLCCSDNEPALTRDVVQFYIERLGVAFPSSITLVEAAERGMTSLLSNQRVRNDRVRKVLGYRFLYPSFREGLGN